MADELSVAPAATGRRGRSSRQASAKNTISRKKGQASKVSRYQAVGGSKLPGALAPGAISEGEPGKVDAYTQYAIMIRAAQPAAKQYFFNMTAEEYIEMRNMTQAKLEDEVMLYGKPEPPGYKPGDLRNATIRGDAKAVSALLEAGLNPNTSQEQVNGMGPLHMAAKLGYAEIVQDLLDNQANPKQVNKLRETPLMHACYWGMTETADIIYGVEPGSMPDSCVVPADHELMVAPFNSPGRKTIICSAPEYGNPAESTGYKVLENALDVSGQARFKDRLIFGYSLGGAANAEQADTSPKRSVPMCCYSTACTCAQKMIKTYEGPVDWTRPEQIAGSRWYQKYKDQLKDAVVKAASSKDVTVIELVAINGTAANEMERDTIPNIINNAIATINNKGGSISTAASSRETKIKILLRQCDYTDFFDRVDSTWLEAHRGGAHDMILKVGPLIKTKDKKMRGTLADVRLYSLVQKGATVLSDRYHLAYAEGDELISSKAKGDLPVYGADVLVANGEMAVTVNKNYFPKHKNASTAIIACSLQDDDESADSDLKAWQEALALDFKPVADGDGWDKVFIKTFGDGEVFKQGHVMKDPNKKAGGLGNRRLVALFKITNDSTLFTDQFNMMIHDGETTIDKPKAVLPLYGADVTSKNNQLTVTVSAEFFPGHPNAGKPYAFSSEKSKGEAQEEANEWLEAVLFKDVDIFSGEGWEATYGSANNCKVLKSGHFIRNASRIVGSLGNRRLLAIVNTGATSLKDQYVLHVHDGDEAKSMLPKIILPLYGAIIKATKDSVTVTVNAKHFPSDTNAGTELKFESEVKGTSAAEKEAAEWADALVVSTAPVFPEGWEKSYAATMDCEVVKSGYGLVDNTQPAGILGNRRLFVLIKKKEANFDSTYLLQCHDGDEVDEMAPKTALSLYGATVSSTADSVSIQSGGTSMSIASENKAEVQDWATQVQVFGIPIFDDGFEASYESDNAGCKVLKSGHSVIDSSKGIGALGNRRLWVLVKKSGVPLPQAYVLHTHDGSGSLPMQPNSAVPLYGVSIGVQAGQLTIGGTALGSSELADSAGAKYLADWTEAVQVKMTPVLEPGFEQAYAAALKCEVLKSGHVVRDLSKEPTALGNRRLLVLIKKSGAPLKDAFALQIHDGDESGEMQPKSAISLYGAALSLTDGKLTVATNATYFPGQSDSVVIGSETDDKVLKEWLDALQVKDIPIAEPWAGSGWVSKFLSGLDGSYKMLKNGHLIRDSSGEPGAYGNRRLMTVVQKEGVPLAQQFWLTYHDGDESGAEALKPKDMIPLYGAGIDTSGGKLTVTANEAFFPGIKKSVTASPEGAEKPLQQELESWVSVLEAKDLPVVPGGWQKTMSAKVVMEAIMVKDDTKGVGAVGNRRQFALTKYENFSSPFAQGAYGLAYYDGTETDGKPSSELPLFGAAVKNSGTSLTVTVSKSVFADHEWAGKPISLTSEKDHATTATADLKKWAAEIEKATGGGPMKTKTFAFKKVFYETVREKDSDGYEEEIEDYGCFDDGGILNYIATKNRSAKWSNPVTAGSLVVKWSSVGNGSPESNFLTGPKAHPEHPGYSCTKGAKAGEWMLLDMGASRSVNVGHYCLRHDASEGMQDGQIRNWELQGSKTEKGPWVTLRRHENDTGLEHGCIYAVGGWKVQPATGGPFRFIRLFQHGVNADGEHSLHCAGIELYGDLYMLE